jgi:hypothetical protein
MEKKEQRNARKRGFPKKEMGNAGGKNKEEKETKIYSIDLSFL